MNTASNEPEASKSTFIVLLYPLSLYKPKSVEKHKKDKIKDRRNVRSHRVRFFACDIASPD